MTPKFHFFITKKKCKFPILEQRELIKSGLQSIIDGSFSNPKNLNPDTLFNSFESLFGPESQIQKNLDQMSQVICGKRAECIETRREHLLTELRNKNVQMALRKVPPSSEYLFNKADLSSLIQSLGGAQNWLNTPAYITSRRGYRGEVPVHKSSSRTTQSSAGPTLPSTTRFEFRRNKTNTRGSFQKPQSIPKPSGSFRKKPADTWPSTVNCLCRGSTFSVSREMERHGGTANHSEAYLRRPNPRSRKAKPHWQLETLQVFHGSVPSDVSGDRTSKGTESRGAPTIFRSQLHLENVPRTEEQWRSQTNFRLTRPQQTCQGRQDLTHFSFKGSRFSSGWRLDDPHRHVPSLPPRADSGVSSMPPSFRLQQGASSVDKLALWPFRCPSYLRNDHELDCRDSSITGYEGGRIFGRLSPRLSKQE